MLQSMGRPGVPAVASGLAVLKHPALLRIGLPFGLLLLFYLYARYSIASAEGQTHRGDTGLGLALLLGLVCLCLLAGYFLDFIYQLAKRRRLLAITDAVVMLALMTPFAWVGCNMFGVHESLACQVPVQAFERLVPVLGL